MKYSINVEGVELVMDKDCYDFLKDKHIQFSGGGYPYISLHRMFFNPQEGMVVDHINRNIKDFRRDNLRHVEYCSNNQNKRSTGKSGIRGVSLNGRGKFKSVSSKRMVQIEASFSTIEEAALFYDLCTYVQYGDHGIFNGKKPNMSKCEAKMIIVYMVQKERLKRDFSEFSFFGIYKKATFFAKTKIKNKRLEKHGFNTAFEAAEWRDNYLRNNGMVYNSYLNFLTFEDICKYRKKG